MGAVTREGKGWGKKEGREQCVSNKGQEGNRRGLKRHGGCGYGAG